MTRTNSPSNPVALSIFVAFTFVVMSFAPLVGAQGPSPMVAIQPATVPANGEFVAALSINGITDFGSAVVTLSVPDTSVVAITNVSNGTFPGAGQSNNLSSPGSTVTINVTRSGDPPGPSGNFDLAYFGLHGNGAQGSTTNINITINDIRDSAGSPIGGVTTQDGVITIGASAGCSGDGVIRGGIHIAGASFDTSRVKVNYSLLGVCANATFTATGEFAEFNSPQGAPFSISGVTNNTNWTVQAWVDSNNDGAIGEQEPKAAPQSFDPAIIDPLFFNVTGGSQGPSGGPLELIMTSGTAPLGTSTLVELRIANLTGATDFNVLSVDVSYDPAIVSFGDASPASLIPDTTTTAYNPSSSPGVASLQITKNGSASAPVGNFTVVRFNLTAVGNGTSGLNLTGHGLTNSTTGDVPFDVIRNGTFTVSSGGGDPGPCGGEGQPQCSPGPGPGPGPGGPSCTSSGGAWVNGTVTNSRGEVVSGAFVNFQNDDTGSGEGFNQTWTDGTFSCQVPAGNYTINANAPNQGQAFFPGYFTAGSINENISIVLSFNARPPYHAPTVFYGGTLYGSVTLDGAPLPNITIDMFANWGGGMGGAPSEPCQDQQNETNYRLSCNGQGMTNATGDFVITGMSNGTFNLNVDGSTAHLPSRYIQEAVTFENALFDTQESVTLSPITFQAPGIIQGHVYANLSGNITGVGNVSVNANPQCLDQQGPMNGPSDQCGSWGQATTNATGFYQIYVSNGTYGMNAYTDSFFYHGPALSSAQKNCGPFPEAECITVTVGNTSYANFTLSVGSVLSGRVVDGDGNGVRANLNVQTDQQFCCEPGRFFWGQTDFNGQGFFNVTVDPGTYSVRVDPDRWERPDLSSVTIRNVTLNASQNRELGNITVSAGGSIEGNITGTDGDAASFVNVMVNTHVECPPGMQFCGGGDFAGFGFTDENGHYNIQGIGAGTYDVSVEPGFGGAFQRKTVSNISLNESQTRVVDIVLSQGGTIAGFVLDATGLPVRGAFVDANWQPAFMGGPGKGPEGGGPDQGPGGDQGPQATGGTGNEDLTVSGAYRYDGNGTSGPLVIGVVDDMTPQDLILGIATPTAQGSYNGTYTIPHVPAGTWRIVAFVDTYANNNPDSNETLSFFDTQDATGPSYQEITNITTNMAAVDLVLHDAPEAGWQGMGGGDQGPGPGPGPTGPGGGQQEMCQTGCWGHGQTDANGYYTIRGLADGTFNMFVRPPFDQPDLSSASLDMMRDTLPNASVGNTTWRNFTLGSAGTIHGCVVDGAASVVPGAWVNAFSPGIGYGGGEQTRGDGCFTIRGVRAGTYEVEIQPPFGSSYTRTQFHDIVVNQSQTRELGTIVLGSGVVFSGTVLDASDVPVQNAFVNVFEIHDQGDFGPGNFGFAQTDNAGAFTIRGLQAGRYGLSVMPPYGSELSAKFVPELRINESGRTGYVVHLGGGGWINGTVTGTDGLPLSGAFVGAWSPSVHSGAGTQTDSQGRFNLTGLEDGTDYNFDAFPPWSRGDLASYHESDLVVATGAGTLPGNSGNVTLTTGGSLIGHVVDASGASIENAFVNVGGRGTFGWGMTDGDGNFTINGLNPSVNERLHLFVQPGFGS
ncbi:MAG: carboxypeptidase regulatory-like domain-containing protein, partial [Candidatus Thermoplasmatota archaeon]